MRYYLFLLLLVISHSVAESDTSYERTGSVNTSVNATSRDGFDCAMSSGKSYLLTELPVYFSSEFGKAGLLRDEYVGKYRLALVIDENSNIIGYQVAPNTDENSLLVQTVINLDTLPALNSANSCIADKPFIFEFMIK